MNNGLISEIQRDSIDRSVPVSALLRKVKLAAAKLNLDTLATWVDYELKGYPTRNDVPEYRRMQGVPRFWNPYRGWQPIAGDPASVEALSDVRFSDPVASLEELVSGNSGSLITNFPPSILEFLSKNTGIPIGQAGAQVGTARVAGILDTVRTAVLDWAIEMEKAGVTGEGFSFSHAEQEKAQSASAIFNIGSIGTLAGNLGVGNVSGDITNAPLNIEQVQNLISQVKSHAEGLTNEGVNSADLSNAISALEKAVEAKKPDLIRSGLNELQKVIAKAAGGLLAHGVLGLLHQVFATGVPTG